MSEQARVTIAINGKTLEISGSEAFVSSQVELFRETILTSWSTVAEDKPQEPIASESNEPPPAPHHERTNGNEYPNIIHIEGDKVQILKSIPGTTNSKKAVGTTLVYLWAKRELGTDAVPFAEIREVCRQNGCLDAPNFASTMKNAREWIVVDGAKGSPLQTCKLTTPGVEKAEAILAQLNGEQSS